MVSKKIPIRILKISSPLEDLSIGEERDFVDANKTIYDTGNPIFLENKWGIVIGAIKILDYSHFETYSMGKYKVLKIFDDNDRKEFVDSIMDGVGTSSS